MEHLRVRLYARVYGIQEESDTQLSMDSHPNGNRRIRKQIIIRWQCDNAIVEVSSGRSSYVVWDCKLPEGKPILFICVEMVLTLEANCVQS